MKKKLFAISSALLLTPFFALAQGVVTTAPGQNILNLFIIVDRIARFVIPTLIVIAVAVFFWGLIKYIWGQGKDHSLGRNIMIAGLASIFVMVTLWGIIAFFQNTLGVSNAQGYLTPPRIGN